MNKKLRWKSILVLAVIALSVFLFFPPGEKINLGLDLQGGMHLVLQVMTDDAVTNETDQQVLRLGELLDKEELSYESITKSPDRIGVFSLTGYNLEQAGQLRDIINDHFGEWDTTFSAENVRFTIKSQVAAYLREQAVMQSRETIGNRVDELGLSEPTIQRQGLTGEKIIVELPGVEDPDRVKEILKTTALLEWRLVKGGPGNTREDLLSQYDGTLPADLEIIQSDPVRSDGKFYVVTHVSPFVGKDLRTARRSIDEWNNPAVSFSFNPEAAKRFANFTEENIGKPLAIILDHKIQVVATIESRIPDSGILRGNYSAEEAEDISLVLRAGALPANIVYLEERTIGPSLGADSIRKGFRSIVIALLLVLVFMVFYYKASGVNAVIAVLFNIIILMGALAYFKASLTLPGIAGIILTIGMAVDANVLVFERIREELTQGKSIPSSISSGFSRAFRTILDANVTTIIAAVFLFQFGTGAIRGFAVTLMIGITASMFTAVFVSRLIFDLSLTNKKKVKKLSI